MAELEPYGVIMNGRDQNGLHPGAVGAEHVRKDLVADERARRGVERIARQTGADAARKGLFRVRDAVEPVCFAELHHAGLFAVRHDAQADLGRLHGPDPGSHLRGRLAVHGGRDPNLSAEGTR